MFIIGYGILAKFTGTSLFDFQKNTPDVDIYLNSNQIIFVTAKNKHIQVSHPTIKEINPSLIPTKEEILKIQQVIGINTIPKLYIFYVHDIKLKIITFNIAGNVQTNTIAGSEAGTVRKCQQSYSQYGGWSGPDQYLSQCTLNAVIWMAKQNPTLIGLQESVPNYLPRIVSVLNQQTKARYQSIGYGGVQFIYDFDLLGQPEILSPPDLHIIQPGRRMIIVWFSKLKLLAINLHAPHNVILEPAITHTFNSVPISVDPDRIIMTGDFNDAYNVPLTEIKIMGRVLKQHGVPPKSCCEDSNYYFYGDYIFDSDYQKPGFYGIPSDAYTQLMSDHHPVMYEEFCCY